MSREVRDPFGLIDQVVQGRFRALALRAKGPNGVVYEAEPPDVGVSRRAIKLITSPEAREPHAFERLRGYVERMRGLEHPNLERVYELGMLPDETPFRLAEWLPLPSLRSVFELQKVQPARAAIELIRQIGRGVEALHSMGLVHGDIRPEHVLLSVHHGEISRAVLIDAGVALRLNSPIPKNLDQLAYWAPERLAGQRATVYSDVYSYGVLTYRLLAGEVPFLPDDPRARDVSPDPIERLCWLHENALPPELHSPLGVQIPHGAILAIGRALSKNPLARFPNVAQFLLELENALETYRTGALPKMFEPSEMPYYENMAAYNDLPKLEKTGISVENLDASTPSIALWCLAGALLGASAALATILSLK